MSGPRLYGKHMLLGRLRAGHAPPLLRSQNEKDRSRTGTVFYLIYSTVSAWSP